MFQHFTSLSLLLCCCLRVPLTLSNHKETLYGYTMQSPLGTDKLAIEIAQSNSGQALDTPSASSEASMELRYKAAKENNFQGKSRCHG